MASTAEFQKGNSVEFENTCGNSRWKFTEILEAEDCFFCSVGKVVTFILPFPWHHVLLPGPMCIVDGVQVHRCGASVGSFWCYSVATRLGPCTETADDQSRWTTTRK